MRSLYIAAIVPKICTIRYYNFCVYMIYLRLRRIHFSYQKDTLMPVDKKMLAVGCVVFYRLLEPVFSRQAIVLSLFSYVPAPSHNILPRWNRCVRSRSM
jgi:hypothetical protein